MSVKSRRDQHINSLLAWHAGQAELFSDREGAILLFLDRSKALGPMTDREIMLGLGFEDMNSVRPRISELVDDGVLEEFGDKLDPVTGMTVRLVRIKADPSAAQRQFDFVVESKAG